MFSSFYSSDFFQNFLDGILSFINEVLYFAAICIGLIFCIAIGEMSYLDAVEVVHALLWARILWPMWKNVFKRGLAAR